MYLNRLIVPSNSYWKLFLFIITIEPSYPNPSTTESASSSFPISTQQQQNTLGLTINSVLDIHSTWIHGVGEDLIITAYWPYMDPSITDDIRHSCGSKVFIPLLTRPSKELRLRTSWKNISCSFHPDYALIKGESSLPLPTTSVQIIDLQIKSFKEDEEVCTLRLNGYEKHPSIFVAYSPQLLYSDDEDDKDNRFPKGYSVVKFPHGISTLLTANNHLNSRSSASREGGSPYFVIFDPDEGRGRTFSRITKCIETIVYSYQNFKTFNEEIISDACVIECDDDDEDEDYSDTLRFYDEL